MIIAGSVEGRAGYKVATIISVMAFTFLLAAFAVAGVNEDLIKGAQNGGLKVVQGLITKGADVNAKDNEGVTALMFASENGRLDVVKALFDNGST